MEVIDETLIEEPAQVEMTLSNWEHPDYDEIFRERVRRLNNIRTSADPDAVWKGLKEFYKNEPVKFINDWGMTSDPRNAEIALPVTVPFIMFKRQIEYVEWLTARWKAREDGLVEKSRDMGVSWLCVAYGVWMFLFHNDVTVGFGSRKEEYVDKLGDPKSLFWKVRKFIALLPEELRPGGSTWNERKHAPSMRIINPENGSVIAGEAGDNIGRGARASIYFVDEAAHIEHPEAVDAALSATSNCKIHVSSVNGAGNPFYKKRHGGEIPVFIFDWKQDPRKNLEWYEMQCRKLDKVIVAQEIDRNYEASVGNAFIAGDLVKAAMAREPMGANRRAGLRIGVDVARFGNDKSAIVIRRGRVVLKVERIVKFDTVAVASATRNIIRAYGEEPEQIAVDVIGIGAGVADTLRGWYPDKIDDDGKTVQIVADVNAADSVEDGMYFNMRAMMWGEMKVWLKTGCLPPKDEELKIDLTALRYNYRGGEIILESKADAKKRGVKSPDAGDALALTFAVPTMVAPARPRENIQFYRPSDSSMGI